MDSPPPSGVITRPTWRRPAGSLLAYALLFAVTAGGTLWVRSLWGAPALVYATNVHDFGDIERGRKVEHTFTMRAVGLRPIEIRRVRPSCTCLNPQVEVNGREIRLKVGLVMPDSQSIVEGKVTIETNSSKQASHTFLVRAKCTPAVEMFPGGVDFGVVDRSGVAGARLDFDLECRAGVAGTVSVRVKDLAEPSPVVAELTRPVGAAARETLKLTLRLRDDVPIGPLTATLVLAYKGEGDEAIKYTVRGRVVGPWKAVPAEVFFGDVGRTRPAAMRFRLVGEAGRAPRSPVVVKLFGDLQGRATVGVVGGGSGATCEVSLDPARLQDSPDGAAHRGLIQVRPEGTGAVVNVPVVWYTSGAHR